MDRMTVFLRPWQPGDASALQSAYESAADLVTQFGGVDLSHTDSALRYIEESYGVGERERNWAIVEEGVAVGNVGLSSIDMRHQTAWVSYWLSSVARGNGYATGAVVAVSEWAYANGLFRLELGHRVNNPASCRVATSAGFVVEGVERKKLRYGEERFDVETHARLITDPRPVGAGLALAILP